MSKSQKFSDKELDIALVDSKLVGFCIPSQEARVQSAQPREDYLQIICPPGGRCCIKQNAAMLHNAACCRSGDAVQY